MAWHDDDKEGNQQPDGLPEDGPETGEWEGGLSAEPSRAGHYQNAGQTEAEDHATKSRD